MGLLFSLLYGAVVIILMILFIFKRRISAIETYLENNTKGKFYKYPHNKE